MMKRPMMNKGGKALKPVKPNQKGLKKLPKKVRNKMGYMKKGGRVKKWLDPVYMQTSMLKESVEVRCVRKVQSVHQKHLTLKEQNKQQGKDNDYTMS